MPPGEMASHLWRAGVLAALLLTSVDALRAPARVGVPHMVASLQEDVDAGIASRGDSERALLQPATPLLAVKQRRAASGGGGFGGGGASKVASKKKKPGKSKGGASKRPLSTLATEMKKSGVVRIDGALSAQTVESLREFVDSEREAATAAVEAGRCDKESRFADLVLLANRCDLLMPL